jgi:Kdo2-lipid IVA lauroyltransferase/acyltransferase
MSGEMRWTKTLRHWVEQLLVESVSAIVQRQPMVRVRAWGEALGRAAHRAPTSRRKVAMDNLAHAFPEMPVAERERIVLGMFEHFGRMLLELIRFRSLTTQEMLALTEIEGEEHVLHAYAQGKGMIFIGGHIGYWEQQGIEHAVSWRPISIMVRPLDNPALHDLLEHIRTRTGNSVIYRQGSIRKVLRALGDNRGVAILIDQHLHATEAVYVNFFGRPAATTSVVGSLVLRTGAATVPGFGLPLPGGRYRFVYGPPVPPPRDDSPEAILDFTQRCTDVIEAYVRKYPELWLWMHRRWRPIPAQVTTDAGAVATGTAGEPRG